MITINVINIVGVPCGTRCFNVWLVLVGVFNSSE
jgi:hypothetical protein